MAEADGRPSRRLGIVGTLVWDRIFNPFSGGAPGVREQWGGAAYSLASLSATCPPGWRIAPILKIGEDVAAAALRHLGGLPHVEVGPGVRIVPEPNNRVELRYHQPAQRSEVQTGAVPPWSWAELEPLLAGLDALYVNFLSGFELDLPTARLLRQSFPGFIYTDLHSLFLGPPGGGPRVHRPLPRWREWLACFDAIQVNETELALLATGSSDPEAFALTLPAHGPRLVLITLGERGVRFVAQEPGGAGGPGVLRTGLIPPPQGALPGDPTGCGDVLGGACVTGILAGLPLEDAIVRAQRLAAAKILHPSTDHLHARLRAAAT